MYRICLINMPFFALQFPSLALTQLKTVVEDSCGDRAEVQILYANHEFARITGVEFYQEIATSVRHGSTGLGDWLFRQAAFSETADNAVQYFSRCYPQRDAPSERFRRAVLDLRKELDCWLDELIARYELDRADLVGWTSMFAQNLPSLAMARKLKERRPAIVTVMGGANCEYPMGLEIVRRVPWIDFVFSGPALRSFPQFVQHRIEGHPERCETLAGVFSKTTAPALPAGVGFVGPAPARSPSTTGLFGEELDINVSVSLDYDGYLQSVATFPQITPALLFETSRGCWWGERAHCTFCGLNGLTIRYRAMHAPQALAQFEALFRYADCLPQVMLHGADNILPKSFLHTVLPRLKTPANVELFYEVKADLTEAEVDILAQARATSIQPGIESLATSTLKRMRKGTTAFQNLSLLKSCLRYGVVPHWNLLIGFPGEPGAVYEKYLRDLPLLVHLPPPTGVFPVRFDRYSPYFNEPSIYGLDLRPCDFYELVYPFPTDSLRHLAYFFIDDNFHADYFAQMVAWIGRLSELVGRWRSRYFGEDGRPKASLLLQREETGVRVRDGRDGSLQEYPIEPICDQILDRLQRPMDRGRLGRELEQADAAAVERGLAFLRDRRLLFEEDGRWLSLVPCGPQASRAG